MEPSEYELRRGTIVLGVLTHPESDMPFIFCDFTPTDAFEELKPVFEHELRLLDADETTAWMEYYQNNISTLGLSLVPSGNETVIEEFLLHIRCDPDGSRAWFRH